MIQRDLLSYLLLEDWTSIRKIISKAGECKRTFFIYVKDGRRIYEKLINWILIHDDKKFQEFLKLKLANRQFNYVLHLIRKRIRMDFSNRYISSAPSTNLFSIFFSQPWFETGMYRFLIRFVKVCEINI